MQLNFDEKQNTAQLSSWMPTETSGWGLNAILECDYDLGPVNYSWVLNHPNLVMTRIGAGTDPEAMQRSNNHVTGVTGVSTPPDCKEQDNLAITKVVVHRSLYANPVGWGSTS